MRPAKTEDRMEDRRRSKRTGLESKLVIKRLDDGKDEEVSIQLIDLSRSGAGFICQENLTIGAVYEAYLQIWTKEVLHAFLQIVRIELEGSQLNYGAVFIGMSESDASRIDVYQTINEADNK